MKIVIDEEEEKAAMLANVLPHDIVVDILLRLPAKSLLRFRCVCKPWYNLLNNRNFVKMNHNRGVENENYSLMLIRLDRIYAFDYDDDSWTCYDAVEIDYPLKSRLSRGFPRSRVSIYGVCDGLLCIDPPGDSFGELVCIWNPTTNEYKKIQTPHEKGEFPGDLRFSFEDISYGFGYDCKIDDYKLIRVSCCGYTINDDDHDHEDICHGCQVLVYTLGTNSWKRIPFIFPYNVGRGIGGVLVNGVLHWRAVYREKGGEASNVVVSFNLGDERFTEISPPPLVNFDVEYSKTYVGNLRGCLCLVRLYFGIKIWVMKDYGVRESWTKLSTIPPFPKGFHDRYTSIDLHTSIQPFKNGRILFNLKPKTFGTLTLYDPENGGFEELVKIGDGENAIAQAYVRSIVSLNTGTYLSRGAASLGIRCRVKFLNGKEGKQEFQNGAKRKSSIRQTGVSKRSKIRSTIRHS